MNAIVVNFYRKGCSVTQNEFIDHLVKTWSTFVLLRNELVLPSTNPQAAVVAKKDIIMGNIGILLLPKKYSKNVHCLTRKHPWYNPRNVDNNKVTQITT